MKEYVRQHLLKHCKEEGYNQDDSGIYEMLRDEHTIYKECVDTHRHWDDYRYVVEIGDMLIGYIDEYSTGDRAGDLGYEFDIRTVCEMEMIQRLVTVYEPKE